MGTGRGRDPSEVMRDEVLMREKITSLLREGPRTIPEIADTMGSPAREVTLWVMALRRYGALEELPKPKADDYYRYKLSKE
ncbi:MAG: hypothetical protein OHK0028_06870 [Deltaproteobacteria bacterium]